MNPPGPLGAKAVVIVAVLTALNLAVAIPAMSYPVPVIVAGVAGLSYGWVFVLRTGQRALWGRGEASAR